MPSTRYPMSSARPGSRYSSLPSLTEDVVSRTTEDVSKVRKGMAVESSNLKGGAKAAVKEAAQRAGTRLVARAGAAGAALTAGYAAVRAVDAATGVGRKVVDAVAGRPSGGGGVKLTKAAQQRVQDEEDFQAMQRGLREADEDEPPRKK